MSTSILLPGQPLPAQFNVAPLGQPGRGCHLREGKLVASVVGYPARDGQTISVLGRPHPSPIPAPDSIVVGTLTRLSAQQATLTLSLVDGAPTPPGGEEYQGLIRVGDVRLTERDRVKMGECFRLGDVVRAKVISLGDARSYYLSTADNELGVIAATSETGNPLLPVSWQEMRDAVTGAVEKRKVAKPQT